MAAVKPIPTGFHSITPHLIVKGADKALDFYRRAFGATEKVRMAGPGGTIVHAEIEIGDSIVMLGEESVEMGARGPLALGGSSVSIMIYCDDADAMFARATGAGATVKMPLDDAFWGDRYGQVTDPFGHVWSIATHKRDMTPADMKKAMDEFFAQMPA